MAFDRKQQHSIPLTVDTLPSKVVNGTSELKGFLAVIKKYPSVPTTKYKLINDMYTAAAEVYARDANKMYQEAIFCYKQSLAIYNEPHHQHDDKDKEQLGHSAHCLGALYGEHLQDNPRAIAFFLQAVNFYEGIQTQKKHIVEALSDVFAKLATFFAKSDQPKPSETYVNETVSALSNLIAMTNTNDRDRLYRKLYDVFYNFGNNLSDHESRKKTVAYQKAGDAIANIKDRNANDKKNLDELIGLIEKFKLPASPSSTPHGMFSLAKTNIQFTSRHEQKNTTTYKR